MFVLNFFVFTSLIGVSWCGLIIHNIRDTLHSKIYGHGLHGETKSNSPVISINNQQQVISQQADVSSYGHQHQQQYGENLRGDYGSLPYGGHHSHGMGMDSNFKAGGINYHRGGAAGTSYGGHHSMGGGFGSGSSHQMMKQENYNPHNGPKFGHHHDNNMFGNTQSLGVSNENNMFGNTQGLGFGNGGGGGVGIASSSSSSSSSSSTSSSSSASSSSSSSSSGSINLDSVRPCGIRPCNPLY